METFVVEGRWAVEALLDSVFDTLEVCLEKGRHGGLISRLEQAEIPFQVLEAEEIEAVRGYIFHRGVFANVVRPEPEAPSSHFLAHAKKLGGTVIDGACRDVDLCLSLGYPIYSRSYSMRTGKDRVQVDAVQEPVSIGNARVRPGDLMRGDADGILVIPREREAEVLEIAETIQAAEDRIRKAIEGGSSLADARKAEGYHQLQSRK